MQRASAPPPGSGVGSVRPADSPRCPECFDNGLVVGPDGLAVPCRCGALERTGLERRLAEAGIPPMFMQKTLANYANRTPAHREVREAARAFAESFDPETHDGILLRGGTGCGKTHVSVAILRAVLERGFTGRFVNFQKLLMRIRESYEEGRGEGEASILRDLLEAQLLVIDDLGAERTTDWVADRLYYIINERYESGMPLIVTTNCGEIELEQRVGQRTASRLYEMCGITFPAFPAGDWRKANLR